MIKAEEKEFIKNHLGSDVNKLLLNPPFEFKDRISWLCSQILARQKAKSKLPDWYDNLELEFPKPLSVEQSSSKETANYKSSLVKGSKFTDLTGGMGIDTLALSEKFIETNYVETEESLAKVFQANSELLGKSVSVYIMRAEQFLSNLSEKQDFIFVDPARRDLNAKKVFRFTDCTPNMVELLPELKGKTSKLMIKASPLIDLKQGIEELKHVSEIHVVSVKNECKEVLFQIDFGRESIFNPDIQCVNISHSKIEKFEFNFVQEEKASVTYSDVGEYLFIPNASILKAGAFKSISSKTGTSKISSNTHLYTANNSLPDFPGRKFQILEPNLDKKRIKSFGPAGVNIITRNYPLKSHEIAKKYKLKEGGKLSLIAFRNKKDKPQMVLGQLLESAETKG